MRKITLILLIVFLSFFSCKETYPEFKKEPDYITHVPAEQKAYFDAYNNSLKLFNTNFEELYIPTQFGTAHVIVSGPKNGMQVVLLHGMNASSTMWYPNFKALSEKYRVFAIDFILEPGKSFITKDMTSDKDIAIWYREIFDKLKLKNFNIIGASRGGWIATKTTLYNSKDINSLILLSPAQTLTWIRPNSGVLKNIIYAFSSKEKRISKSLETLATYPKKINNTYLEQYKIAVDKDSINKFMMDMVPYSDEDLKNLKMPVYVLIGDDDMINSEKSIKKAKEVLPYGRGEIINNAGHFLSMDQAEIVNQKMLNFLEEMQELYNQ